ncbi:hypothetical protein [Leminorella grimontii]|uniref:hypothetical protein n=1 Tax=Leminorella grimontii TaxID=82981 RepID=UPI00208BA288|nr:hypothetical protein [Leminorella grimontii]GKX60609.1 hypothetical protein SOASR031_29240 [Leminorella grimontii]
MKKLIIITEVAYRSLDVIEYYQALHHDVETAAIMTDSLLTESTNAIATDPSRYGFNQTAAENGLRLRQWFDEKQKHRVLFELAENNTIYIHLYCSTKQNLEQLLYQMLITA